jgi:hypothetical protein
MTPEMRTYTSNRAVNSDRVNVLLKGIAAGRRSRGSFDRLP